MPHKDKNKHKEYQKKYYKDNQEKIIKRQKELQKTYASNAEKQQSKKQWSVEYYKLNREEIKEKQKKYNSTPQAKKLAKIRKKRTVEKIRQFVNDIKTKMGCQNPHCFWKGTYEACELDFHHLKDNKIGDVAAILLNKSKEILVEEIKKCTILCANCHRRVTFGLIDSTNFKYCEIESF